MRRLLCTMGTHFRPKRNAPTNQITYSSNQSYLKKVLSAASGRLKCFIPLKRGFRNMIAHNSKIYYVCNHFQLPKGRQHNNQTWSPSLLYFYWFVFAFSLPKKHFLGGCRVATARVVVQQQKKGTSIDAANRDRKGNKRPNKGINRVYHCLIVMLTCS